MMIPITITHVPSKQTKEFPTPRVAYDWLVAYRAKGLSDKQLKIVSPIDLSVYDLPAFAITLIEKVHRDYDLIIPNIHWMEKPYKSYGTGRTYYRRGGGVDHIAISATNDAVDTIGVILHELCHALVGHLAGHGRKFYRTLFEMLRRYLKSDAEQQIVEREANYKASSKYWYDELYGNFLYTYSEPVHRPSKEEKAVAAINAMFED